MSRATNRALLGNVLLPTIFLTVALLGGVRVEAASRALLFVAPPLVTLVLAAMLLSLFVRGGAIRVGRWLSADAPLEVEDPELKIHSAAELKAELQKGTERSAEDLNPLKVFRERK